MILDGQNEIFRSVKKLFVKLDEVVGRQERELSLLTMISQVQPHAPPADNHQVVITLIILLFSFECANSVLF